MAFGKTKTITVEISEDTKAALRGLDSDVQALVGLVDEMVALHGRILESVKGEIALVIADETNGGVEPFADQMATAMDDLDVELGTDGGAENGDHGLHPRSSGAMPKPPAPMQQAEQFDYAMAHDDPNRVRTSPFTRAPRGTQVQWLLEVMADGAWYAPITIARETANDDRHYRYLRHAIQGRMREMHEEGVIERRDSHTKGSMFEYRLREK